jgi:hypothetical protein
VARYEHRTWSRSHPSCRSVGQILRRPSAVEFWFSQCPSNYESYGAISETIYKQSVKDILMTAMKIKLFHWQALWTWKLVHCSGLLNNWGNCLWSLSNKLELTLGFYNRSIYLVADTPDKYWTMINKLAFREKGSCESICLESIILLRLQWASPIFNKKLSMHHYPFFKIWIQIADAWGTACHSGIIDADRIDLNHRCGVDKSK